MNPGRIRILHGSAWGDCLLCSACSLCGTSHAISVKEAWRLDEVADDLRAHMCVAHGREVS